MYVREYKPLRQPQPQHCVLLKAAGVLVCDLRGLYVRGDEAAEVARANLNLATKNRMKIDEHRAVWLAEDAKEQEARAEGELEDFVVRKEEI